MKMKTKTEKNQELNTHNEIVKKMLLIISNDAVEVKNKKIKNPPQIFDPLDIVICENISCCTHETYYSV